MVTWCAVIGEPISHSLSPQLHLAAYTYLELDWDYRRIRVLPDDLSKFVDELAPECMGLSVTMPHKQSIMAKLDHIDGLAKTVGAVNTVVRAREILAGFNTDVYGLVEALRAKMGPQWRPKTATVLGGRASASSALAALTQLGVSDITVAARTLGGPGSSVIAAGRMGISPKFISWRQRDALGAAINSADVVISTVPKGVADDLVSDIRVKDQQVLLDIVYDPWPSPLSKLFLDEGANVVSGKDMLVYQALMQIKLFTGQEVPPPVLFAALT